MQIAVVWAFSYCQRYCGWRSITPMLNSQSGMDSALTETTQAIRRNRSHSSPLPNDFWHLLNRTLQAVSLLTASTPVLLATRPSGHHLVNSLQPPVARCYSPSWQWSRASTLSLFVECERCVSAPRLCVCVCHNSPECNCYESRRIWFALHASRLTERECLSSHIQKQLSAGWNSGYSVSLFCHWHLHLCFTNGNSAEGKHRAFHLSSLSLLPSWSINCNLDQVCVLSDSVTITVSVLLHHNKGQILPPLLNNSETRWTLFSLISGSLCLYLCPCVCVGPGLGVRRLVYPVWNVMKPVCVHWGVCLCVCVYSKASWTTSSPPMAWQMPAMYASATGSKSLTNSPSRGIAANVRGERDLQG